MTFQGCCASLHSGELQNQPRSHPHSQPPLTEAEEEFSEVGVLDGSTVPQPCHWRILNIPESSVIKRMNEWYSTAAQTPFYFPYKCRTAITPSTLPWDLRPVLAKYLPCPTDISSLAGTKIHRASGATAGGMTGILGQESLWELIFQQPHQALYYTRVCACEREGDEMRRRGWELSFNFSTVS